MKKGRFPKMALAVAIVLAGLGLIVWFRWTSQSKLLSSLKRQRASAPTSRAAAAAPSVAPSGLVAQPQMGPQQIRAAIAQERAREAATWDLLFATPISFYGKVTDQNGAPVADASVEASFANTMWGNGNTKAHLKTDASGAFYTWGHGLSVVINVSKEGYYHMDHSGGSFVYSKTGGHIDPHPDPDHAAHFVLRKMGHAEPQLKVRRDYLIPKDGTPVEMSLSTGLVTRDVKDTLKVEAWTYDADHQVNSNKAYDWHCRISIPGGGLQPRTGEFAFEAPESGYQANDTISMPATAADNWRSQVSRKYFAKLASGNYARIDFTMTAENDHFFSVSSYMNPSGSRNLEAGKPDFGESP